MGVLPDWQIQRDIKIEPFADGAQRSGTISYGVTSYGYDVRVSRRFKVFTVDSKHFDSTYPVRARMAWPGDDGNQQYHHTTPLSAKIYAGEGIAQILFLRCDAVCRTSYADKKGKYQDQKGLTLPFVVGSNHQP